jgi:L-threonylcarbamoyladenylate synthase
MIEYDISNLNEDYIVKNFLDCKIGIVPTETVYGLAGICKPFDLIVKNKIYNIKKRDISKNLVLQIGTNFDILEIVENINENAEKLINKYFPGPITLIFKASSNFIKNYDWNIETVAIRIPNHEFLLSILNKIKNPLFVTSANISGEEILNDFDFLKRKFENELDVDFIVKDEGTSKTNIPSTIIDVSNDKEIKILREGVVSSEEIFKILA